MAVTIRPATPQDVAAMIDGPLPWRIHAIAVDGPGGELLGIGGFSFQPDDTLAAFAIWSEAASRYPIAKHRAGLIGMKMATEAGYRRIVALADKTNPAAERWLKRLGYQLKMVDNNRVWVWERDRVE